MRVTVLKAPPGGVGGLVAYYGGRSQPRPGEPARGPADYYLDPDEPPGRWWGQGRGAHGLDGEVAATDLGALLEGRAPGSGGPLGRSFSVESVRGFDATFSAPKSVSLLWALSPDPWVRQEVLAAHDAAVDAAMGWFETEGAVTRRGRDGFRQVDTRGVTVAVFRQHTSRTMDPQLHTHAVVSAKVQDPSGKWLALDGRFLVRQQRTIGWVYDAALRSELTHRLGVEWGPLEGGQADLTAVSPGAIELFSRRSAQVDVKRDELIERWSHDHDGADPDPRTIARLERSAVLASRPGKTHGVPARELHHDWREQSVIHGIALPDLSDRSRGDLPAFDDAQIVHDAIERAASGASGWLPADLARHVATLIPTDTSATAAKTIAMIDRLTDLAVERCIPLGPVRDGPTRRDGRPELEHVTDRVLTIQPVLDQELTLQDWALSRATRPDPAGPSTDRQADAAAAISGTGSLVLVVGPAGTGKTTTIAAAVADLDTQDRPVLGLAPSGKAADLLRSEAGCPSDTLAGFLLRHEDPTHPAPAPGTTLIVDEAGMAATDDIARLVGLANRRHWRLAFVGDPAQLPSVGRGGLVAHWCDTIAHFELDTPRRFQEPWEADASLAIRRGQPNIADTYAAHDRLHATHPALLPGKIAQLHREHEAAGRSVAITTSSAETAREINQTIQRHTPEPAEGPRVGLHDDTTIGIGDQIATRRNDRTLRTDRDEPVRNRQIWTVQTIDPAGNATVHDRQRGTVRLPADYVAEHVELGWAVTGYGNQGDTVDIGLAILEPGTTRNHAYVALTRGRQANHAWIPDPTGLVDPAQHLERIISQEPRRQSALAIHHDLHLAAGIPTPTALERPGLSVGRSR
jgi:conjugative relaxase-like TrwC/TraI family protein